jgi:predicted nucleic acid-binding protein
VTGFLLDTNVVSELRKGDRAHSGVSDWIEAHAAAELWLSVLVVGELWRGVELIRRRDPASADVLSAWLEGLTRDYQDRILPITNDVVRRWAEVTVPDPVPVIDGLLAATALEHDLVLVTRNVADIERTGVVWQNPFE